MEFLSEYNTVENWTLFVAIATFIVTLFAYIHTRRSEKRRIKSEIARKEAQFKRLDDRFTLMGIDHTVADMMRVQKDFLKDEIEQLRKDL